MPFDPTTNGVALVLALGALLAVVSLVQSWRSFLDEDFTAADRQVATQVAVFLVTPVVVLLHELGHVAAALAVGARVTRFRYRLFEGAVGVEGNLSPAQDWFVAVAGSLVSVLAGLALVVVGARATGVRRSVRYVLVFGGIFQLLFAVVGYPLLSATASFGDWLVIYDFSATPALAWLAAAVHVSVLAGLWRWWRGELRVRLFAIAHGHEAELDTLRAAVGGDPGALEPRLALARHFASRGDLGLAGAALDDGVGKVGGGDAARLHLTRARLALERERWNSAFLASRAGLESLAERADHGLEQQLEAAQSVALTRMGRRSDELGTPRGPTAP